MPLVLLLRALRPTSDAELFHRGCGGDTSDSFVCDRLQLMLLEAARLPEALHTPDQCLSFLGARFRPSLRPPARLTDAEVGRLLLRRHVLVHLAAEAVDAKWELLLLMLQKLYALAAERCAEDSPDSLVNQEMLLPGHLWLMIRQEKRRAFLAAGRDAVVKKIEGAADDADFRDARWFRGCLDKGLGKMKDVGQKLTYFLATGNLVSETGLDLQQSAGYTIVAERLNYWRYLAHFRSIHRGAFFAQLRTTSVRKLLPDSWGFLCPVHTPDGSPCGLLNHLAVATSRFSRLPATRSRTSSVLAAAAGAVLLPLGATLPTATHLPILFDGELIARVPAPQRPPSKEPCVASRCEVEATARRRQQCRPRSRLQCTLEIALVLRWRWPLPSAARVQRSRALPAAGGQHSARCARADRFVGADDAAHRVRPRRHRPSRDALRDLADRPLLARCVDHALLRLQSVATQHVPVPDGQADHGNAVPRRAAPC